MCSTSIFVRFLYTILPNKMRHLMLSHCMRYIRWTMWINSFKLWQNEKNTKKQTLEWLIIIFRKHSIQSIIQCDSMIERHWNSAIAEFSCEKNARREKWEQKKENEMKHRFAVICLFVIYKLTAELKTLANFLDYSTTKWFKSV